MMENEDLLSGPARDAHFEGIRYRIMKLLQRAHVVVEGQDRFDFDDDDRRQLDALVAELDTYRQNLDN